MGVTTSPKGGQFDRALCLPLEGVPVVRLKVWERGRESGSFPVEEGNEVKDRVLETVGF
jgi:hypothetical protein